MVVDGSAVLSDTSAREEDSFKEARVTCNTATSVRYQSIHGFLLDFSGAETMGPTKAWESYDNLTLLYIENASTSIQ